MSNANPLREPSMDEILASIRRIIESGDETPTRDTAGKSKAAARIAAVDAILSDDRLEREPAIDSRRGVPNFDVTYGSTAGRVSAVDTPMNTNPIPSHAGNDDIATTTGEPPAGDVFGASGEWNIRDADRRESQIADDTHDRFTLRTTTTDLREARDVSTAGSDEAVWAQRGVGNQNVEDDTAAAVGDGSAAASGADFAFEFDEAEFAAELQRNTGSEQESPMAAVAPNNVAEFFEEPPAEPDAVSTNSVIASASALLSEQAGEQVAAAFDNLAIAIREGQMRSMEGMAREMLRPMLQEWLDDNLPQLVERLVRGEIERVARGAPRR